MLFGNQDANGVGSCLKINTLHNLGSGHLPFFFFFSFVFSSRGHRQRQFMCLKDSENQRLCFELSPPTQTARPRHVCRKAAWDKFVQPLSLWAVNGIFSALHFHLLYFFFFFFLWKSRDFGLGQAQCGFTEV